MATTNLSVLLALSVFWLPIISIEGGNVVIFSMLTRSQLLSVSRIASILAADGHKVTIVIPANDLPDIKPSPDFDILTFETDLSREFEQEMRKSALSVTPWNLLLGRSNATTKFPSIIATRCAGALLDEGFLEKLDALKADLAIVHSVMACMAAHFSRKGVPFMDFCSVPLMPFICGGPHRIPANPSYVPDALLSDDEMSFFTRVANSLVGLVARFGFSMIISSSESVIAEYQDRHGLPRQTHSQLRGHASFLLVHGDLTFETIRPTMPKVVYVGGVQCDAPRPLDGDLKSFVEGAGEAGIIVFSLGGALDTDGLPNGFIQMFFDVFRPLPQRVVWKLKKVPRELRGKQPDNVMLVDWMPQQDLLGHGKTKLFISHGGIQGSFESICHGKPLLGVGLFGDQLANLRVLKKKGMAIVVDDYKNMDPVVLKSQIRDLLENPAYAEAALKAQSLFRDQPQTPAQRLQFAVGYALRHRGAYHLSSKAAMDLHWLQFYLIDVLLFIVIVAGVMAWLFCACVKRCWKCCHCRRKPKEE